MVAPLCDPADKTLLACYAFEGSAADGSSYGNNLTTATGINYVPGKSGLGLSRGPMSVVTAPTSPTLGTTELGTVEMWIKPTQIPPGDVGQRAPRAGLLDNGRYSVFLYPGGTIRCAVGAYVFAESAVVAGEWAHIACVYDGVMQTIYINGKAAGSVGVGAQSPGPDLLAIGADSPTGTADPFEGVMDNIRLFSAPRTPEQICEAAGGAGCP